MDASTLTSLINLPESKKDKDYHLKVVKTIVNGSLNTTFNFNYIAMQECANFFQSMHTGDEFEFLQFSEDGEAMPAKWLDLNRIRAKLNIVIGEFNERGYDIEVRALNKDAVSRRILEKERLLVEMRMKPYAQELQQSTGVPFYVDPQAPDNEDDLEEFIKYRYKETCEVVVESALKWLSQKFDWSYLRSALFRDILVFGRCFVKVELVNGLPVPRRIDPRSIIFDPNSSDDYLSDSSYWGEVRYMNLADCIEQYGLTKEEIEEILTSSKGSPALSLSTPLIKDSFVTPNNQIIYTKPDGDGLRVLVTTAYWVDTKPFNYKVSKDKYGNEHYKRTNKQTGENIIKRHVKIWRKGTLIAGKILKDWGVQENMVRSVDNYYDTYPPYIGCIPNFINGKSLSLTQMMMGPQKLKNVVAYNMQLALARAGAKGVTIDVSQIPDDMSLDQVIKYVRVIGVNIINSKKDGVPSNYNQFQNFDMSISDSIIRYVEIMAMLDREMDAITGINEARQGLISGASQTVGVTQSALFQSNLATSSLFKMFRWFASKMFTQMAGLVKISWLDRERFAPIIGDVGVDFLTVDVDVDLNDYGVFVYEVPPMIDDLNTFKQFVLAALQSGAIEFADVVELMLERDVKVGVMRLKKALAKRQQQQAIQQQMAMEAQQSEVDQDTQLRMAELEAKMADAERNREHELRKLAAQGIIDLKKKKVDAALNL